MRKVIVTLVAFCIILFIPQAHAFVIDMYIVEKIESGHNPQAVSYKGAKYGRGLYQISEKVLAEWNEFHPQEQYRPVDLFNPQVNEKIAHWYMFVRISHYIRHYDLPDRVDVAIAIWNWGIGNVRKFYGKYGWDRNRLPEETRRFISKYNRLKRRCGDE